MRLGAAGFPQDNPGRPANQRNFDSSAFSFCRKLVSRPLLASLRENAYLFVQSPVLAVWPSWPSWPCWPTWAPDRRSIAVQVPVAVTGTTFGPPTPRSRSSTPVARSSDSAGRATDLEQCSACAAACARPDQQSLRNALGEAVERPQWLPASSLAPGRRRPSSGRTLDTKSRSTRVPSRLVSSTTGSVRLSDEWRSPLRGEKRGNP